MVGMEHGSHGFQAGLITLEGCKSILFNCSPGDDILAKIALECETQDRTLVAAMGMQGLVMSPRLMLFNNQLQKHEGSFTLITMTMMDNILGKNGGSASTCCTVSIVGTDGNLYGGTVVGPLIAASPIIGTLLVRPIMEAPDSEEDSSSVADSNGDSDSGSCLTSESACERK